MPGFYVFPGGAVEPSDRHARPATPLDPAITDVMAVGGRAVRGRSLAMAAIRETFEETGLLLGEAGDVGPPRSAAWAAMRRLGLAPALGRLVYVGRAITPVRLPIRFHARFFVADARFATGELESGDDELEHLRWRPLEETFALPLADVQRFMLAQAVRAMAAPSGTPPAGPLFAHRAGRRHVRHFRAAEVGRGDRVRKGRR